MTFPNFKHKHAKAAMFSAQDYLAYQKKLKNYDVFPAPESVIFCYSNDLLNHVVKNHKTKKVKRFFGDMYLLTETKNKVALVGNFGIGAPVVTSLLEELIAFGVKKFISIGTAGGLQKSLKPGDLVVCDRAIRDEGASHHYMKASKYALASKAISLSIKKALDEFGQKYVVGTSWTIDTPYRETVAEARQYQKEGVLTVEMEASALFAVAQCRRVAMGAIFTISDSLAELQWAPKFHLAKTKGGLELLYKVALRALK